MLGEGGVRLQKFSSEAQLERIFHCIPPLAPADRGAGPAPPAYSGSFWIIFLKVCEQLGTGLRDKQRVSGAGQQLPRHQAHLPR